MINQTFELQILSHTTSNPDVLRVLMFSLSKTVSESTEHFFALPVEGVLKVIPCPPINWAVGTGLGMTDLGSNNVTTLDLAHQFFPETSTVTNSYPFLILLKTRTSEQSGIPVAGLPILTDIPLSTIRPVSSSYRQVAKIDFASHMAILSDTENKKSLKIFLLGMDNIINERLLISSQT